MGQLLFTIGIILFGLSLGYEVQFLVKYEILKLPFSLNQIRLFLLKAALLFIMPLTVVGAIWMVKIKELGLLTLPFLGIFAILLGGFLGMGAAKIFKLERKQAGSLFTCSSFTNIGTLGGLICFLFLGEGGFGLVPIYKLFEETVYYTIGFPIAKLYGEKSTESESRLKWIKRLMTDPFILVSISSIVIGVLLNLSRIQRPAFYQTVNSILIPFGALLLITSIGLAMKINQIKNYLRECLTVSLIKFFIIPVILTSLAYCLNYGKMGGGLPLKVVMILSSMPVAFNALIPPSLYHLDLDLANSCWLFTTSLLFFILPILYTVVHSF